jgi:hypothetical protein
MKETDHDILLGLKKDVEYIKKSVDTISKSVGTNTTKIEEIIGWKNKVHGALAVISGILAFIGAKISKII